MGTDNSVVPGNPIRSAAEELRGTLDDWWRSVVAAAPPVALIKIEIEIGGSPVTTPVLPVTSTAGATLPAREPIKKEEGTIPNEPLRDGGFPQGEGPTGRGAERG
jgi:hypothetical protein